MGCSSNPKTISITSVKPSEKNEKEKNNDNKKDVTNNGILYTESEINENVDNFKSKKILGLTPTSKTELIISYITGKKYVNKSINNQKYFELAIKEYQLLSECTHPNIIHFKNIYKKKKNLK